jgi:glycerol-3-phosphate dehydrogenase
MEFILPHDKTQRPRWLIRLGLFLYDRLGGKTKLKSSKGVNLQKTPYGSPLQTQFTRGFRYFDCWADDSRLVAVNAVDAARNGADIRTKTACIRMVSEERGWSITLRDLESGKDYDVSSGMVVNAAGPWVRKIIDASNLAQPETPSVRLVKGSHIIIPKAYDGDHAYILQQPDKRVVFVIPYEKYHTLIGTTEIDFAGNPSEAVISDFEIEYLCGAFNRAFKNQIEKKDILWTYSGVRPLFDDGEGESRAVTRDYRIHHHAGYPKPLLSIFGGKLTTYRMLSEKVVTRLLEMSGHTTLPWTRGEPLPGGNIPDANFEKFVDSQIKRYAWLPYEQVYRYARAYGTAMDRFLDGASKITDLGKHYGDGVYEAEIVYLVKIEFAKTLEDILWRRSKLGVHISPETAQNIERALSGIVKKGFAHERRVAGD